MKPIGWKAARLGDLCDQDRQTVDPSGDLAKTLPYIGLEQIESGTGRILRRPNGHVGDAGVSTTFAFDARHVLYGKLRPYLNKIALPEFKGRCTTELIPLLPKPGVCREFVALLLRRPETVAAAMQEKTGSRMPRANVDHLMNLRVRVPSEEIEQHIIAAEIREKFERIDQARAAAAAQLEAAKGLPTAYLREVFESPDAQKWPTSMLGDVTETSSGSTPDRGRAEYYRDGTVPWVKTGELVDGLIEDTGERVTELALQECSIRLLPVGTVLVAMYGQGQTRGRTGLLRIEATTNQACFAILPNPARFRPEFLQFWFRHSYSRLRLATEGRGGNQPNLNGMLLRELRIPLPSTACQQAIGDGLNERISKANRLTSLVMEDLMKLEMLPGAMLLQVFEGDRA